MKKLTRDDMERWDRINSIKIIDAATMWAGFAPPCPPPILDSGIYGISESLLAEFGKQHAGIATVKPELTDFHRRKEYKAIAKKWGEQPKFLFPEKRRKKTGMSNGTLQYYRNCYDGVKSYLSKGYNMKTAAAYVAKKLKCKAASVERNYRRGRQIFENKK